MIHPGSGIKGQNMSGEPSSWSKHAAILYHPIPSYTMPIPCLYDPYTIPIPSLYRPYTIPIPKMCPYTIPIPALYHPFTTLLYRPIPFLYHPLPWSSIFLIQMWIILSLWCFWQKQMLILVISDENLFYLYLSHEFHERQRCPFLGTLFYKSYMLAGQTDVQIEPSSIGQASKRRHGCQLLKTLFSKSCLAAGEGSMFFSMELSEICSTHFCLFAGNAGKNEEFRKYKKTVWFFSFTKFTI